MGKKSCFYSANAVRKWEQDTSTLLSDENLHPPTIPHLPPPLHLSAVGLLTAFSHPHPLTVLHKKNSAAPTHTTKIQHVKMMIIIVNLIIIAAVVTYFYVFFCCKTWLLQHSSECIPVEWCLFLKMPAALNSGLQQSYQRSNMWLFYRAICLCTVQARFTLGFYLTLRSASPLIFLP